MASLADYKRQFGKPQRRLEPIKSTQFDQNGSFEGFVSQLQDIAEKNAAFENAIGRVAAQIIFDKGRNREARKLLEIFGLTE